MFYDQRGPLVFSASIHLVLLVVTAIWALMPDEKDPEDFVFELVPPPAAASVSDSQSADQPMEQIRYESQHEELPTLDDIELPERPPITVEVEMPEPEPVVEQPVEETPVVEIEKPKPKAMTWEEYQAQNPDANQVKNVDNRPERKKQTQIDLTSIRKNLSQFTIANLPSATIEAYSAADQEALSGYLASFKAALKRAVASHPFQGRPLTALVSCDISAGGLVSNARIIRSSGDAAFDRKILDGYAALRNFQAPPKGTPLIGLQIEFVQSY